MKLSAHISKYIGVMTLVFVLMLPMSVLFSHLFENHEHEVCLEQTTHLHEDEPECHICDFYSTSFQYTVPAGELTTSTTIPKSQKTTIAAAPFFLQRLTSKQLRAPPTIFS
tara:strand:+ start:9226 stop:9558 length:333 start_codon:yes stop_codon:yes gene_type:complete